MKQNMKRLAALALALSMCLSLLFNNAWMAEVSGYTEDDFVVESTTDIDSSDAESEEYGEVLEVEADAAEEEGADNIPDDALSYNGHYYYFYDEACTWWDAKEYCESVGGYLVTITTEDEQNAVYCYVEELAGDEDIWIGITDSGTEGDWSTWITGEAVTYTNWGENEPDDLGGQDYGVICTGYRDGGSVYYIEPAQWDDVSDTDNHFLCEWGDLDDSSGSEEEDGQDSSADYTWVFGQDNFSFLNSKKSFGSGEYYIEDEMFYSYLETLTKTQVIRIANAYGAYSWLWTYRSKRTVRLENFLKNELVNFDGSCYGMCLVATLIKTGNLSAEDLGAATTYELGPLSKDENTELESIINLYLISQYVDTGFDGAEKGEEDFAEQMEHIWNVATTIGSGEQPFLMCLHSESGNHAVVCYGAETGDFSTGALWWKNEYDKRLLIYNPNSDNADYIYISEDFSNAELGSDSAYTGFYIIYGLTDENNWNTFSEYLDIPHYVYLDVDNQSLPNYTINASDGTYATISNGSVIGGTLDVSIGWVAGELADGEEAENSFYTVCLPDTSDYYTLSSADGESLDALLTYDDFSVGINGAFESATIYSNGTVDIQDGEGDLAVNITFNDSDFGYVSIVGELNGDVLFQIIDDTIYIIGDLSNYLVENMDNNYETSTVYVEDDIDVQALMEDDTVVLYEDTDGDGEYETSLPHTHYYIYTDNGDGTHTATCIGDDDNFTEAHTWDEGNVTIEPTCIEEGVMTYTCSVCGETKTEAIAATGHTWDEGVMTQESTTETEGVMTYICTVCGETCTAFIAALEFEQEGGGENTGEDAGETSCSSKTTSSKNESSESSPSKSETSVVKTGDSANLILWEVLAGIALLAMAAILLTKRTIQP
ncbi:MAG: C-type lectin domain-containing protein [Lachnospiraceae bacterium]|nr:C-type lectin domain-containing protein [Lachnospiraceae bacterium]